MQAAQADQLQWYLFDIYVRTVAHQLQQKLDRATESLCVAFTTP